MHQGFIGEEINGYRLLERLSESGMSDVYLAESASRAGSRKRFAFKIVHNKEDSDPHFVQRFMREMRILEEIQHPHILPLLDWGISPGELPYTVTEYIEDLRALSDLMAERPLTLQAAWQILAPVFDVLAHLHADNILHRDLRPEKIYVLPTQDGYHGYMGNLGMSKQLGVDTTVTDWSITLSAPGYVPPEHSRGEPYDTRSDIYLAAIVTYHVMLGEHPFDLNQSAIRIIMAHDREDIPPPTLKKPDFPPALESVIMRSLAKRQDDRHPTIQDFAAEVSAVLARLPADQTTRHYWLQE
ncbi:MAG: serine/threonine protein kinase [Anaerolineales bacterium]